MKLRERLVRLLSTDGKQSICEPPVVREPSLAANRRMLPHLSKTVSCSSRKFNGARLGGMEGCATGLTCYGVTMWKTGSNVSMRPNSSEILAGSPAILMLPILLFSQSGFDQCVPQVSMMAGATQGRLHR